MHLQNGPMRAFIYRGHKARHPKKHPRNNQNTYFMVSVQAPT